MGQDDLADNCWLTSIVVDETAGWSASELSDHLEGAQIESRPLWKPMHPQPVFAGAESAVNGNAQCLLDHGLTLPSGSGISDADLGRITAEVSRFLAKR